MGWSAARFGQSGSILSGASRHVWRLQNRRRAARKIHWGQERHDGRNGCWNLNFIISLLENWAEFVNATAEVGFSKRSSCSQTKDGFGVCGYFCWKLAEHGGNCAKWPYSKAYEILTRMVEPEKQESGNECFIPKVCEAQTQKLNLICAAGYNGGLARVRSRAHNCLTAGLIPPGLVGGSFRWRRIVTAGDVIRSSGGKSRVCQLQWGNCG